MKSSLGGHSSTFPLVILGTLFVVLIGSGCDQGRVIDQAERQRVITGKTPDTSPTAGLSIGRDGSGLLSRQGKYFFTLWDTRNDAFASYSIALESLLRLDAARAPQVTTSLSTFDLSCAETVGPDCIRWTRNLNLTTDVSGALPSINLSITLTRGDRYQLEGDIGAGNQVIANYETFDIDFVLGLVSSQLPGFPVVKQNFADDTPVAILSQGWLLLDGFEVLDALLSGFVFFPVPSYGLFPETATRLVLTPTRWQIDRPFLNVTTGATQTISYVVEKL